ncbi:MAG: hypothetical protein M0Z95_01655, partial [Actinomycetota bacterium]|nr:hypothetical protein [Actinomycetota bacterium]
GGLGMDVLGVGPLSQVHHRSVWIGGVTTVRTPLLLERGLLDGSTARLVPKSTDGASVVAEVSTPFKLRQGSDFTIFGPTMQTGLPVRLGSLSFDPDSERLTAKLVWPVRQRGSTATRRKPTAMDELHRQGAIGGTYYGINTPFGGMNWRGKRPPVADDTPTVRELPLDVALAAAD